MITVCFFIKISYFRLLTNLCTVPFSLRNIKKMYYLFRVITFQSKWFIITSWCSYEALAEDRQWHYGGKDYLIIVDYYSLWPEVYLLPTAISNTVIDATKQTFSRNGIPEELISDNGSLYNSKKFRQFMNALWVKKMHKIILWFI